MRSMTGYRFDRIALRKLQIPLLLVVLLVNGAVAEDALAQSRTAPLRMEAVAGHADLDNRGIYFWFADGRARAVLRQVGLEVGDTGLIYIGKTTSFRGFRARVLDSHINGTVENSTLRKTLRGVLIATNSSATRTDVSEFMRAHLRVALESIDADRIDSAERQYLATNKPLLNSVQGNPNLARVRELRRLADGTRFGWWKGVWLAVVVEASVALIVAALDVANGRASTQEAALGAARSVALAGLAGGAAAGLLTAAAGLGLGIGAPVAVPLAVAGGGAYLISVIDRVLGALDDKTREEVVARLASVRSEIEKLVGPMWDRVETGFTSPDGRGTEAVR